MTLKCTLSISFLFLFFNLYAQQNHFCINDQIQLTKKREINSPHHNVGLPENVSTKYVNTVIHIIYNKDSDSIPSEDIEAIIENLNRLFRAEGIDTSFINPVHRDKLIDSQIQFCLAQTDPDGEPTTGINYKRTDVDGFPISFGIGFFSAELVKNEIFGGVAPWDIDNYFNIWIAQVGVNGENYSYGIPREEYFPLNAYVPSSAKPGALIDIDNLLAPPPFGTLEGLFAHECGHALGLLHTFHFTDDGTGTISFCDGSDFMDDTPQAVVTTNCDPSMVVNTCIDSLNDEPDNATNFMNNSCMLMFTPDQISAMHNNLSLAPSGLLENSICETISSVKKIELENNFEFNIYPNPNNGNFTVEFSHAHFSKGILSIHNSIGQVIFKKNIDSKKSLSFQINQNNLGKGIYYLSINSEQGIYSKKMVVR